MEQGENESRLKKVLGKGKSFLQAGILAGALIGNRGGVNQNKNAEPIPDSTYSQVNKDPKLDYHAVASELAREENFSGPEQIKNIPFKNMMQGIDSNLTEQGDVVISDKQTLKKYWDLISTDPIPELKPGEIIILTAMGEKNENVHATVITNIDKEDVGLVVNVESYDITNSQPQETSAYHAVKLSAPDQNLPIVFRHRTIEGEFDFSVTTSSRTDGQKHSEYSPTEVTISPHIQ